MGFDALWVRVIGIWTLEQVPVKLKYRAPITGCVYSRKKIGRNMRPFLEMLREDSIEKAW